MLFQDLAFWALAIIAVIGALGVVLLPDLFRSALLLVLVFLAAAGLFFLLAGEFLGVVQILIYAGAISILIIFAVMLTQNVPQGNQPNHLERFTGALTALLLAALIFVFIETDWRLISDLPQPAGASIADMAFSDNAYKLSNLLLREFALAFGAAGALLLAAIIGALSLVREP